MLSDQERVTLARQEMERELRYQLDEALGGQVLGGPMSTVAERIELIESAKQKTIQIVGERPEFESLELLIRHELHTDESGHTNVAFEIQVVAPPLPPSVYVPCYDVGEYWAQTSLFATREAAERWIKTDGDAWLSEMFPGLTEGSWTVVCEPVLS